MLLLAACNSQPFVYKLPAEIKTKFHDSLNLDPDGKTHIGDIKIFDSILVAEAFDKETRQDPKLSVFNLHTKTWLGNFPWPDPQASVYFGVALDTNSLIYFSNYQYFRRVGLISHKIDTIPMKKETSELVRMVIIKGKIYSLENIYGLNIVDLNNTERQILIRPYPGYYYNEQNSISLPVDSVLNLVASGTTASGDFVLYAVDTGMTIKWQKTITLKEEYLKIESLNFSDGFLVKFDNKLMLISKKDGATIWSTEFPGNIYDIIKDDDHAALVSLTKAGDMPADAKKSLVKFDIRTRQTQWKIDSIEGCYSNYLNKDGFLYGCMGGQNWFKIDLAAGKLDSFPFLSPEKDPPYTIGCTATGRRYLRYGNTLYW